MTAPAITPGPWFVKEHPTSFGVNSKATNLNIATVTLGYNRARNYDEKRANAKAIAAVPAMVEALQLVLEKDGYQFVADALRAAGVAV
jgi:hypothetical protein